MSVSMNFGNLGNANTESGGMELIESGYLGGENRDSITINVSSHQMYILFTREITISSGAVRGFRAVLIARTESETTVSRGNLYASGNSGVTITADTDETITLVPSSTSYDVYYALYAVV